MLRERHNPPDRSFSIRLAAQGQEASHLIHDRDTEFTAQFDSTLQAEGIAVKEPIAKSPNMNASAKRWAQSVQCEILCRERLGGLLRHYCRRAA